MKFLSEVYPANIFVKVPRRHFAESDGNDFVTKYCSDKYNFVKEAITTKYYALSAVAGLSKYLQYIHNVFFKENSLKLEFGTKYAHMQIGKKKKSLPLFFTIYFSCQTFLCFLIFRHWNSIQIRIVDAKKSKLGEHDLSITVRCAQLLCYIAWQANTSCQSAWANLRYTEHSTHSRLHRWTPSSRSRQFESAFNQYFTEIQ